MTNLRPQPDLSPETLPTEFVIDDLETTGLSPERCEMDGLTESPDESAGATAIAAG